MEWQTTDLLPEMLVRTRQFTTSARWWNVTVWNGLDGEHSREWQLVEAGCTEDEAIMKAAETLRDATPNYLRSLSR